MKKMRISSNVFAILCILSFTDARNLRNMEETENIENLLENVSPVDVIISIENKVELNAFGLSEQPILEKPSNEPIYCPATRYESWFKKPRLFRTRTLFLKLGYNAATWNFEPLLDYWNELEESSWSSPALADVHDELESLGYDEDKWDCCINHYEDFNLQELAYWNYTEQVQALYALGWTPENFGSTDETLWPDTENLSWQNLTEYQQYMAASKLCYTEETWDEELSLNDWPEGFAIPDAW